MELIEEAFYPNEFSAVQRFMLPGENDSFPNASFDTLLDEVCERLQNTSHKGSLRRLKKLEETLAVLERELEELQMV